MVFITILPDSGIAHNHPNIISVEHSSRIHRFHYCVLYSFLSFFHCHNLHDGKTNSSADTAIIAPKTFSSEPTLTSQITSRNRGLHYTRVLYKTSPGYICAFLNRSFAYISLGYPELAVVDAYRAAIFPDHPRLEASVANIKRVKAITRYLEQMAYTNEAVWCGLIPHVAVLARTGLMSIWLGSSSTHG